MEYSIDFPLWLLHFFAILISSPSVFQCLVKHLLHDTESSLHIVDLWLHALDGLHF